MANNNIGGCAGGILQIFGGIGMLFMTCARMGDDVMRCGSAASKFDDIGRTGSRVYYPLDDAALSSTYTKYADDAFAARVTRTENGIEASSDVFSTTRANNAEKLNSSVVATATAKRPRSVTESDYVYYPLRIADLVKNAVELNKSNKPVAETELNFPSETEIEKVHEKRLKKFCDLYILRNTHFDWDDKLSIVRAIKRTTSLNFLFMRDALTQIDRNIETLNKSFPEDERYVETYKQEVLSNFQSLLKIRYKGAYFAFSSLPLADRESDFSVLLDEREVKGEELSKAILREEIK